MSPHPHIPSLLAAMNALADDTRLRLLRLLETHELGVGELGQILQLPQPTVSRHLKTLSDAGFASSRREGTSNLYHLRPAELSPSAKELWTVARAQTTGWPELEQDTRRLTDLLRAKQSSTQAFFAGAAGEWDRLRAELYGNTFTTTALLSLLPPTATIADLACGTGSTAALLAPHVGSVIAIDNSPEMLAAARTRLADFDNVTLEQADLTTLPIPDGTCDAALLLLALTYVPDPAAALTEAARILKPKGQGPTGQGGTLVIVDLLPHTREDFRRKMNQLHPGLLYDHLSNFLTSAGLSPTRHTTLPSASETKGPALFLAVATKD